MHLIKFQVLVHWCRSPWPVTITESHTSQSSRKTVWSTSFSHFMRSENGTRSLWQAKCLGIHNSLECWTTVSGSIPCLRKNFIFNKNCVICISCNTLTNSFFGHTLRLNRSGDAVGDKESSLHHILVSYPQPTTMNWIVWKELMSSSNFCGRRDWLTWRVKISKRWSFNRWAKSLLSCNSLSLCSLTALISVKPENIEKTIVLNFKYLI